MALVMNCGGVISPGGRALHQAAWLAQLLQKPMSSVVSSPRGSFPQKDSIDPWRTSAPRGPWTRRLGAPGVSPCQAFQGGHTQQAWPEPGNNAMKGASATARAGRVVAASGWARDGGRPRGRRVEAGVGQASILPAGLGKQGGMAELAWRRRSQGSSAGPALCLWGR